MAKVTQDIMSDALTLSDEILSDVELNRINLTNVALKCCRLSRLLNEIDFFHIFQKEVSGYKSGPDGIDQEEWKLMKVAGRTYKEKLGKEIKEYGYTESIETIEEQINTSKTALEQASDPDISVSSANPNQYVMPAFGNKNERDSLQQKIQKSTTRLSSRRSFIYQYVLEKNIELKYSGINENIFSRLRASVDSKIGNTVPEIIERFNAVYNNLQSDNNEDWSNAVHSCRRIIQALADKLYPPRDPIEIDVKGKKQKILLGNDNYINRLIQYITSKSDSDSYQKIVGSQLSYFGERLDNIYESTNKGTHETITNKVEADRYVIYTYMLLFDILSL